MRARFLLGPAGSGKTFRCLSEIREELRQRPDGPDLILLAPKQATFQLERQLLADGSPTGYTRLQILSFERLAAYVFGRVGARLPELLSEEGRVMVLRAILERKHKNLKVYRASARLAGFSRQLSELLRNLQRHELGPAALKALTARKEVSPSLADKLSDLAMILEPYLEWVSEAVPVRLEDASRLLDKAVDVLRARDSTVSIDKLWLDGFAEMTPQEQALVAAVLPHCQEATLAFCLPAAPANHESWLSPWAVVSETAGECLLRIQSLPGVQTEWEVLEAGRAPGRFQDAPLLARVERVLGEGLASEADPTGVSIDAGNASLQLVQCSTVEMEARCAAREILGFVQGGGRFRDCAVLMRRLEGYQDVLRRVFTRYDIPFFLDRREPVAHHPLAELTRFALRTVTRDWRREDWLGVLKTGLSGLSDAEVDRLENAALSRGWEGAGLWLQPLPADGDLPDREWLEARRARVTGPFHRFHQQLEARHARATGGELAAWLRGLWEALNVEERLDRWSDASERGTVHTTVWDEMNGWLDNVERAFSGVELPLIEWLQIVEAGLSGLTVGVIPPALDQVLIGSVDRSRNPDLKFALVLGLNEGVFPSSPPRVPLLTDIDVEHLESCGARLGNGRRQYGHERYLGYIALTRARERLLVSWSAADHRGRALNRSRFVDELLRAFPGLAVDQFDGRVAWSASRHAHELAGTFLCGPVFPGLEPLLSLPPVSAVVKRWRQAQAAVESELLGPGMADVLYGANPVLSVSALEAFASCPFKFFIAHGLKAGPREEFEVDARQTGSFQHEVLAAFHKRVLEAGCPWRELTLDTARQWVREIGEDQLRSFEHGIMLADANRAFHARALLRNLEELVVTLTGWARHNEFEPAAVEVGFGLEEKGWPAWSVDVGHGRTVRLRGRIDRVDLLRQEDDAPAVAIFDYKSGGKAFDELRFENGLQLQMPVYLNAICANPDAAVAFSAPTLRPAGVFYVGLRAKPASGKSRAEAEMEGAKAVATAFQHRGRLDATYVRQLDTSATSRSAQFKFSFNKNGQLSARSVDVLPTPQFTGLLRTASDQVRELADRIFAGEAAVSPYAHGSHESACQICDFRSICRFDPWSQPYRPLERRKADRQGMKETPCR